MVIYLKSTAINTSTKCYLEDRANHSIYSIAALVKTKAFGVMLAYSLFRYLKFSNKLYIFNIAVVLDVTERQSCKSSSRISSIY